MTPRSGAQHPPHRNTTYGRRRMKTGRIVGVLVGWTVGAMLAVAPATAHRRLADHDGRFGLRCPWYLRRRHPGAGARWDCRQRLWHRVVRQEPPHAIVASGAVLPACSRPPARSLRSGRWSGRFRSSCSGTRIRTSDPAPARRSTTVAARVPFQRVGSRGFGVRGSPTNHRVTAARTGRWRPAAAASNERSSKCVTEY